jgi:2,5-diamino-6-(ribosylamino)-4(3H)-pyrimidinone 5'-phosphate reductase
VQKLPRPYAIIFSTETVDGKIADSKGYSKLSCEEDFKEQHELRSKVDAVMVGANTIIKDNPSLTVRLVKGVSPIRIVVDSRLKVSEDAEVFNQPRRSILITSVNNPYEKLEKFIRKGINIVKVNESVGLDLNEAMNKLYEFGIRRLMIEGGGHLNFSLLSNGLVDEIWATVSPFIFGRGVSIFENDLLDDIKAELSLKEVKRLCYNWVSIRYIVLKPKKPLI